jgi:hypothetical protein
MLRRADKKYGTAATYHLLIQGPPNMRAHEHRDMFAMVFVARRTLMECRISAPNLGA